MSNDTTDDERWAEARAMIAEHGNDIPKVFVERCMPLVVAGDWDAIGRLVDLVRRCETLKHEPRPGERG